jgi:hypothetical protein
VDCDNVVGGWAAEGHDREGEETLSTLENRIHAFPLLMNQQKIIQCKLILAQKMEVRRSRTPKKSFKK